MTSFYIQNIKDVSYGILQVYNIYAISTVTFTATSDITSDVPTSSSAYVTTDKIAEIE